jgi:hypothetical protein
MEQYDTRPLDGRYINSFMGAVYGNNPRERFNSILMGAQNKLYEAREGRLPEKGLLESISNHNDLQPSYTQYSGNAAPYDAPVDDAMFYESVAYGTTVTSPLPKGRMLPPVHRENIQRDESQAIKIEILERLVENVNLINRKLGISGSDDKETDVSVKPLTLVMDGRQTEGTVKQSKSGKIYYVLSGGEYCYELTPSSMKKIKTKK